MNEKDLLDTFAQNNREAEKNWKEFIKKKPKDAFTKKIYDLFIEQIVLFSKLAVAKHNQEMKKVFNELEKKQEKNFCGECLCEFSICNIKDYNKIKNKVIK